MLVAHTGNYKPESTNGANVAIAHMVRYLTYENINIELWNFTKDTKNINERHIDGINIYDLPIFSSRLRNFIALPNITCNFLQNRRNKIDLLHIHSVFRCENIYVSQIGIPYIVTPHTPYSQELIYGRNQVLKKIWLHLYEYKYLKNAKFIHTVSPLEEFFIRKISKSKKIKFIPKGIDLSVLTFPANKSKKLTYWLYLGRLDIISKGLDLLLNGFSILYKKIKKPLPTLIIVGPEHCGSLKKLQELASILNISTFIEFKAPVYGEEKLKLISEANIFIHTSRYDALPFSVTEALALGRPVIITKETGFAEYISKYNAGWIVENNPEAIADGLLKVLNMQPDELNTMGENGRVLIKENFDWSVLIKKLIELYDEALKNE